jgi:hypothetical protein
VGSSGHRLGRGRLSDARGSLAAGAGSIDKRRDGNDQAGNDKRGAHRDETLRFKDMETPASSKDGVDFL